MKGVQCYELFGGIALKNHTISFHIAGLLMLFLPVEYFLFFDFFPQLFILTEMYYIMMG